LVAVALVAFACAIFLTLSTVIVEALLPNHSFTIHHLFAIATPFANFFYIYF